VNRDLDNDIDIPIPYDSATLSDNDFGATLLPLLPGESFIARWEAPDGGLWWQVTEGDPIKLLRANQWPHGPRSRQPDPAVFGVREDTLASLEQYGWVKYDAALAPVACRTAGHYVVAPLPDGTYMKYPMLLEDSLEDYECVVEKAQRRWVLRHRGDLIATGRW